jgi:hypothetical protein
MPANGERRRAMNRVNHPIPSIGKVMGQGGFEQGSAGKVPRIREVMKQDGGTEFESGIPTIQRVLRQGGGTIK